MSLYAKASSANGGHLKVQHPLVFADCLLSAAFVDGRSYAGDYVKSQKPQVPMMMTKQLLHTGSVSCWSDSVERLNKTPSCYQQHLCCSHCDGSK